MEVLCYNKIKESFGTFETFPTTMKKLISLLFSIDTNIR